MCSLLSDRNGEALEDSLLAEGWPAGWVRGGSAPLPNMNTTFPSNFKGWEGGHVQTPKIQLFIISNDKHPAFDQK